ncbi:MAG: hypothetical protein ACOYXB_09450 [Bacteroidota bacterium]
MPVYFYQIAAFILLILAVWHYFKYNDEFLFLPVLFFMLTGISRYKAVLSGKANWVSVAYTRNIFTEMTFDKALWALGLFFLGTFILSVTYSLVNSRRRYPPVIDNDDLFTSFMREKRILILILFFFFVVLNSVFKGMISGNLALGNSYFLLFGMAIAGLILLAYLVYKSYNFRENFFVKLLFLLLMIWGMFVSYSPSMRFQFISWMVALGILVTRYNTPWQKTKYYAAGGAALLLFFALAGVARTYDVKSLTWKQRFELAAQRNEKKLDQNMLDGFMMVLDVYPEHLNYSYGMEHFEILLRPIPRRWWPGKPLGGYHNKLGLNNMQYGTVGISQTIYGSFYGEGGWIGIILFSVLYGWLFVALFRYALRYESDLKWLLKGVILASFIPILRGGDLPGIVAFIGMSYWPVFLIVIMYNRWLRTHGRNEDKVEDKVEDEVEDEGKPIYTGPGFR